MAESDWEFLRGIFLMEAWETVAVLEDAKGSPVDALQVVTHRLKGAASLHGFPEVADVASDVSCVAVVVPTCCRQSDPCIE